MPISRLTTLSPSSSTESNTRMSFLWGSRTAGKRLWMSGTSAPYSALLTNRKSPISRVFSMLPEGIRNASTRKVRRRNHTRSATTIDLVHSHAQIMAERDRLAGPPGGGADRGVEEGEPVRAVMPASCSGAFKYNGTRASHTLAERRQDLIRMLGGVGHPRPVVPDPAVRADPYGRSNHPDHLPAV